jgi:hypothetical protein
MDGWIVSSGVALLHAGHKMGLMCIFTVYLHNHLFCIRPGFMAVTFVCVACILVEVVWSYRLLFIAVFWVSTIGLRPIYFESIFPSNGLLVSNFIVHLNQKKVRKIKNFSMEKTIPYPEFEPRTSQLVVGSLNHCTTDFQTNLSFFFVFFFFLMLYSLFFFYWDVSLYLRYLK